MSVSPVKLELLAIRDIGFLANVSSPGLAMLSKCKPLHLEGMSY